MAVSNGGMSSAVFTTPMTCAEAAGQHASASQNPSKAHAVARRSRRRGRPSCVRPRWEGLSSGMASERVRVADGQAVLRIGVHEVGGPRIEQRSAAVPIEDGARDREILVRLYLQEEEKDTICRDLGLEAEHFDKVLHRARGRLKELLEASGLQRSDFFMLCL